MSLNIEVELNVPSPETITEMVQSILESKQEERVTEESLEALEKLIRIRTMSMITLRTSVAMDRTTKSTRVSVNPQ